MPQIQVYSSGRLAGPHRLWPWVSADAVLRSIFPMEVVTASFLANLSVLRFMDALDLRRMEFTDDAMEYLATQSQIKGLILCGCTVSREAMKHVGRMSWLTTLVLAGSTTHDEAIEPLTKLDRLSTLI